MDGSTTSAGGQPVAPFLTDDQYQMLFDEPRPTTAPNNGPVSASRAAFIDAPTTRWDRRKTTPGDLLPPPVPRLDLTGDDDRLELDIFAEDRVERSLDVLGTYRPRFNLEPAQFTPEEQIVPDHRSDVRSRAVSLAFAIAALTATIALWMIAIAVYY